MLTLLVVSSCKDSVRDVFTETPAERFEARTNELKNRLLDAPNGWIMEYVPHQRARYGGYIIGFRFNDKGQALITSEALENPDENAPEVLKPAIKSSYHIGRDNGVTLNFMDYNEALHYYSTPDRGYAGGLAKGYEGDYEFRFMKSDDPNVLNFIGKKTGNKIRMYKAPEDMQSYVKKVVEMKRRIFTLKQMFANRQDALIASKSILGQDEVKFYYPNQERYNYYEGKKSEDDKETTRLSFFYTSTGIRFFDHKSGQAEEFVWNEDKQMLESEGGVSIEARPDPYYDDYESFLGDYTMILFDGAEYPVKFTKYAHNTYLITGLPYNIKASYDYKNKRFGIEAQVIDNQGTLLALGGYSTTPDRRVVFRIGYGMVSNLIEGSNPARYEMVDNGLWGFTDSFVLVDSRTGGVSTKYAPARIITPVFIRK